MPHPTPQEVAIFLPAGLISSHYRRGASRARLLDQTRNCLRVRHHSYKTEKAYLYWIKRHIAFHRLQHPKCLGATHVMECLSALARATMIYTHALNRGGKGVCSPVDF